ncbi:MAG: hypothetical protein Q8R40_00160 [bacterium]|nr:hypothetical protein [bacterium]
MEDNMKSYWFVRYTFSFNHKEHGFTEIKGNSVHELPSKTFLPGSVMKVIKNSLSERTQHKHLPGSNIEVCIESFGETDEDGFNDFAEQGNISEHRFYLNGVEYYQKSTQITFYPSHGRL